MATCSPAGALLQAQRVVGPTYQNASALHLLEMALEAKVGIAHGQHLGVHRTMRGVADCAAFTQRFMFEYVRSPLRRMTFETIVVLA